MTRLVIASFSVLNADPGIVGSEILLVGMMKGRRRNDRDIGLAEFGWSRESDRLEDGSLDIFCHRLYLPVCYLVSPAVFNELKCSFES